MNPWPASWLPNRSPTVGWSACGPRAIEVDVVLDLTPDQLLEAVVGAEALIIRSATT